MPPRVVRVLPRGNWMDDSGPVVLPGVPASLPPMGVKDRRAIAARPGALAGRRADNPLVARVMVNRLWKLAFGQGLVTTPDDFGSQGTWPTHPELLDWLACEFVDGGWDVKAMLKRMVMSAAYRQSSRPRPADRQLDPANRWLSRQNAFRLDAELDPRQRPGDQRAALATRSAGPASSPTSRRATGSSSTSPRASITPTTATNQYRRGLYTYWQRTFLHPSLLAFDASTREECVVQRPRSNTPLQALVLLNDPTYVEAARVLAARVIRGGRDRPVGPARPRLPPGPGPAAPARRGRGPAADSLAKHERQYRDDPAAARELLGIGDAPAPAGHRPGRAGGLDLGGPRAAQPPRDHHPELKPMHGSRPMDLPPNDAFRARLHRRAFLGRSTAGVGSLALASLLDPSLLRAGEASPSRQRDRWPGAIHPLHFAPRAKRIIYLYMAGGPSHLETFDSKPDAGPDARPADARVVHRGHADRPAPGAEARLLRAPAPVPPIRRQRARRSARSSRTSPRSPTRSASSARW